MSVLFSNARLGSLVGCLLSCACLADACIDLAKVPAKVKLCYLFAYEKDQPDEGRNVMCGSSGYFEVYQENTK